MESVGESLVFIDDDIARYSSTTASNQVNLLLSDFFVDKKLGHSLSQLKVQQLHNLCKRLSFIKSVKEEAQNK